ncbi:MAG: rod shape-determining protein RodA [Chlorobi bacterium]|nr:rod shape-determining protein RodA [Chlorobiota bacterium]
MKISHKIQDRFDLAIFIPVVFLIIIGLAAIYSSTINHPVAGGNFQRQLFWVFFSFTAMIIVYFLPSQTFRLLSAPIYVFSILLLIAVLVFGKSVYGARSWLSFGGVGFQPSEFAKIGLIFFLSYWFNQKNRNINNLKDVGVGLLIGLFPVMLILLEPDMGTAIIFIVITLALIFWNGISLFGLFIVIAPGFTFFASMLGVYYFYAALLLIIAVLFLFKRDLFLSAAIFGMNLATGFILKYALPLLQPHQQKRIESFVNPMADPLGAGYNALQARLAVGSGGLFGKGFMQGNQTQLRFIPEQWTDFIFCVIGEEFGFIGSILIIVLFTFLFLRLIKISSNLQNRFSSSLLVGIVTLLFTHFVINIGMNVGLMPVIGVPLPFLSYGGSSLLMIMMLIGVALNISKNKR